MHILFTMPEIGSKIHTKMIEDNFFLARFLPTLHWCVREEFGTRY